MLKDLHTISALDLDPETPIFNRLLEQWRIGVVCAPLQPAISQATAPAPLPAPAPEFRPAL